MNDWTRLPRIASVDFGGKKLDDNISRFNEEVESLDVSRTSLDGKISRLKEELKKGTGTITALAALQNERLALLHSELKFRQQFIEILSTIDEARRNALENAFPVVEAKRLEIRQRLLSIGYLDEPIGGNPAGKIAPGYIENHPEVSAARERVNELRETNGHHTAMQLNQDCVIECQRQINVFVDKLTS